MHRFKIETKKPGPLICHGHLTFLHYTVVAVTNNFIKKKTMSYENVRVFFFCFHKFSSPFIGSFCALLDIKYYFLLSVNILLFCNAENIFTIFLSCCSIFYSKFECLAINFEKKKKKK